MNVERYLRLIAGVVVIISIGLAVEVSLWFLAFTAFVGVNLAQSAFTNWCPVMSFLRMAGVPDNAKDARSPEPVA